MSTATMAADWGPKALRHATERLWAAAAADPRDGIGEDDALAILPEFGDDAADVLWQARDVGELLAVWRAWFDEAGEERGEWRYFAIGGGACPGTP